MTPAGIFPSECENAELRGPIGRGMRRTRARSLNLSEKRCPGCGTVKPIQEFTHDAAKPHGYGTYCLSCERVRSKRYYAANREAVLARAAEKRGPTAPRFCSECSLTLEGGQRVTCGSTRCREARFKRLHPEAYAKREARKVERRRQARRRASKKPAPSPAT
jgi:hypothetical protein